MTDTSTTGLPITNLVPDSPAIKAGLKVGDVVIAIDNRPIRTHQDYVSATCGKRDYHVEVLRGGRQLVNCHVELGEASQNAMTLADYERIIGQIEKATGEGSSFDN